MIAEKMFVQKPDIDFKRRRTVNPTIRDNADNDATSIKARNRRRRTTKQNQNKISSEERIEENIEKSDEDGQPAEVKEAFNINPDTDILELNPNQLSYD